MARVLVLFLVVSLGVFGLFDDPELVESIEWEDVGMWIDNPDFLVVLILYDRDSELCVDFEEIYTDFI
jgi:hypothetical protein